MSKINKWEADVINIDQIAGSDVKINPDFYIHLGIIKAQNALTKDNVKEGFLQYRVLIEHVEVLCKAANMLTDDYKKDLGEYKKSKEYKEEKEHLTKSVKLATKKLHFMMREVFAKKTNTKPMKA